jgi:phosphatidylinositol alpha-mannosyltransferase
MPLIGPALLTSRLPLLLTFHADPPDWAKPVYRLAPARWWKGRISTAVSEVAARALPWPTRIIPNAIDTSIYQPEHTYRPAHKIPGRVVFLGRDEPRKGLDILRSSWSRVHSQQPDAELWIIGTQGRAEPGVSYRGVVDEDEKRQLLATASVFVAPNTGGESFGVTVLEAMAAGCAVVASDLPAFRALTAGSATLVPPGNVTSLAGALSDLIKNPARIETSSRQASEVARRYDWHTVIPEYLECYRITAGAAPEPS